jgi:hypothetical protein
LNKRKKKCLITTGKVEKVNDAFANNDIEAFLDVCAVNIRWTIVGDQEVSGKDAVRELMKSMECRICPRLPSIGLSRAAIRQWLTAA